MKAELTNENKAKFFALYYDQPVAFTTSFVKGEDLRAILNDEEIKRFGEPAYLTLKPLSSISDEDAIELNFKSAEEFVYWVCKQPKIVSHLRDELRFLGYAYEWMGLSVDEMVDAGWIKLTES